MATSSSGSRKDRGTVPPQGDPQSDPDTGAEPVRIAGLDHVVLRVQDLERSIRFYEQVLGCHEERRIEELGLVQLRAGQSLIDLVDIASPLGRAGGGDRSADGPNLDHFALRLEALDEPALRTHLGRFGVEAGETSERYGAEGFGPSIYLRDPDGNTVELKGPAPRPASGAIAAGPRKS
jgi:catechol 2,3-dioxygenase-like lactoylglutathione lyase family enzyme